MNNKDFRIMSFNIKNSYGKKEDRNSWYSRKEPVFTIVRDRHPDLAGLQEVCPDQMEDFKSEFNNYKIFGIGRDDGKNGGEHSAIMYNPEKFELLEHGDFWLSDTPEVPSMGWDAVCIRICTWGKFMYQQKGIEFLYMNTHLDHVGRNAMLNGASMLVEFAKKKGLISIVTGDFNCAENSPPYSKMRETYDDAKLLASDGMSGGTFHNWTADALESASPIDYIFLSKSNFTVGCYEIIRDKINNQIPSDHYPIIADVNFN